MHHTCAEGLPNHRCECALSIDSQFDLFADGTPKGGILIYWEQDKIASVIMNKERADVLYVAYKAHPKDKLPETAALEALKKIGVTMEQFAKEMTSYKG